MSVSVETSRPARRRGFLLKGILAAAVLSLGAVQLHPQAAAAHEYKAGGIQIDHPWARATPGGASVGGGYLVLKNTGATPDRLVSASAPFAGRSEIHEMSMANGVMTMRPLPDGLALPPGGTVTLKPGSYHIMFQDLKQPLKEGDLLDGTLTFEKAGTVPVKFKVEGLGAGASAAAHQHQGH